MEQKKIKLGDVIDDYCTRCRLLMNHGVVVMVGMEIGKVRCLTCKFEHPYRHARIPKKRNQTKALFEQVRKSHPTNHPSAARTPEVPAKKTKGEIDDDTQPAARLPREPAFRKPRSHSLAAQRGVQKGKPFTSKRDKDPRRR